MSASAYVIGFILSAFMGIVTYFSHDLAEDNTKPPITCTADNGWVDLNFEINP
ncbi:MAG: hypothetical protein R3B38_01670 [Patescibacteria group bacterium]